MFQQAPPTLKAPDVDPHAGRLKLPSLALLPRDSSPNFTIASAPIKMLAQSYLGAVLKILVSAYFTRSALNFLGEGE